MRTRIYNSPIKMGYLLAGSSIASALAHFFIRDADIHVALLSASFAPVFVCIFLGFQVQPREMVSVI